MAPKMKISLQLMLKMGVLLVAVMGGEGSGRHPAGVGGHPPGVGRHPPGVGGHSARNVSKIVEMANLQAATRPCSRSFKTLKVYNAGDFAKRLIWPATQSVKVIVMKDLTLTDTLTFSKGFECTLIVNGPVGGVTLNYPGHDKFAVVISHTHNIIMKGVSVSINIAGQSNTTTTCTGYGQAQKQSMCGAMLILRSYGIQIVKASIRGRVELMSTAYCKLDHLTIKAKGLRRFLPGAVTISHVGIGTELVKSQNVISNCDISGPDVGITMILGSVGNVIANNHVHDFTLFGISCGYGVHSSGDCMLNDIRYNKVINKRKSIIRKGYTTDSAGIYFNLHWWGPGNVLTCNYVQGPGHCYYLDYATSGVTINGGMCISNDDGVKINTGKENKIKDLVVIKHRWQTGFVSCQNYNINNCLVKPGEHWDKIRSLYFNSRLIRATFPAFNDFCDQATYNRSSCNPPNSAPATATGKCSGIPTGNSLTIFTDIKTREKNFPAGMRNCAETPVAFKFNYFKEYHIGLRDYKFNNMAKGDYGIDDKSSYIYKLNPKFKSCPLRSVGIQYVADSVYYKKYNMAQPWFWELAKTYRKP